MVERQVEQLLDGQGRDPLLRDEPHGGFAERLPHQGEEAHVQEVQREHEEGEEVGDRLPGGGAAQEALDEQQPQEDQGEVVDRHVVQRLHEDLQEDGAPRLPHVEPQEDDVHGVGVLVVCVSGLGDLDEPLIA